MMIILMRTLLALTVLMTFSYAELVIAYDTPSIGDSNKIVPRAKIEIDKISKIANANNIKVIFKPVPWKRSLLMVEKGKIDGVIQASYKTSRSKYAQYPIENGMVDDSKRLNDGNSYYIYRNKNSLLRWDGEKFLNSGVVAAMDKYAVIEDLEKHTNITIKTFTKNANIIRQLANGKLDAYAGSAIISDRLLKKMPVLAKDIVRDSLPIRKKPYFLIFSKISYKEKSKAIEKIWNGLKQLNDNNK